MKPFVCFALLLVVACAANAEQSANGCVTFTGAIVVPTANITSSQPSVQQATVTTQPADTTDKVQAYYAANQQVQKQAATVIVVTYQ